jgi:hypothetical protein
MSTIRELYEAKERARVAYELARMTNVEGVDADMRIELDIAYERVKLRYEDASIAYYKAVHDAAEGGE